METDEPWAVRKRGEGAWRKVQMPKKIQTLLPNQGGRFPATERDYDMHRAKKDGDITGLGSLPFSVTVC